MTAAPGGPPPGSPRPLAGRIRPVRVDEAGRIFYEDTGEQLIMPGLEPETILASLADLEAGRTVPLEQVMAECKARDAAG